MNEKISIFLDSNNNLLLYFSGAGLSSEFPNKSNM